MVGAVFTAMSVQWTVARAVGSGLWKEGLPFMRTAKGGTTRSSGLLLRLPSRPRPSRRKLPLLNVPGDRLGEIGDVDCQLNALREATPALFQIEHDVPCSGIALPHCAFTACLRTLVALSNFNRRTTHEPLTARILAVRRAGREPNPGTDSYRELANTASAAVAAEAPAPVQLPAMPASQETAVSNQ